jgi:hypothetical protein
MRRALSHAILILAGSSLGVPSGARAQAALADLAGTWALDTAANDDTKALEEEAAKPAARMPGERGPVRVRVGGDARVYPGGGFGAARRFDPALFQLAVNAVKDAPARITIAVTGDTVLIARGDSAPETFVANGRKVKRPWLEGEAEIRAEWKDGRLRIERKLENDLKFEETWTVDAVTRRLIVQTVVDGPITRKIELRRSYSAPSA